MFKDSSSFFRDFSVYSKLSGDEREEIRKVSDDNRNRRKTYYGKVDISLFFETDLNEISIDRTSFMKKLGLIEVKDSNIQRYLQRRCQPMDSRFAWDPKRERIFLFNLTAENRIIGLQVRNMESKKGTSKYLTYKLSGIYEKMLRETREEVLEKARSIDPISHVFGISFLDFDHDITIFEGPMDSWLWPNSTGLCSLENKFPFDIETKRFWYDWDESGITKTMDLLSKGETVFNWGKFLEDHEITKNRKWDLNDLVIHLRTTGKKIKRFENYFTNDVLDLRYFINK